MIFDSVRRGAAALTSLPHLHQSNRLNPACSAKFAKALCGRGSPAAGHLVECSRLRALLVTHGYALARIKLRGLPKCTLCDVSFGSQASMKCWVTADYNGRQAAGLRHSFLGTARPFGKRSCHKVSETSSLGTTS